LFRPLEQFTSLAAVIRVMTAGIPRRHLSFPRRVVIVGPSADCREVLETALVSRGLQTFAASEARTGLKLICEHEPDVVVLDGETEDADDGRIQAELEASLAHRGTPLIVLGRIGGKKLLPRQVLAKPYHFAPLVHTIEALAAAKAA
jgi:DNA-binding NtrC family response regulator